MAPPNDYVGSKNGLVIETKYICRLLPDDKIFRLLVTRGVAKWRAAPPRHPRGGGVAVLVTVTTDPRTAGLGWTLLLHAQT